MWNKGVDGTMIYVPRISGPSDHGGVDFIYAIVLINGIKGSAKPRSVAANYPDEVRSNDFIIVALRNKAFAQCRGLPLLEKWL